MNQFVTEQLIYVLRLVAAALCGGLIGCERQSKKKISFDDPIKMVGRRIVKIKLHPQVTIEMAVEIAGE